MTALPRFPEFKPVGLEDRAVFQEHFLRRPPEVCEANFTTIFVWRDYERSRYTTVDGSLCVFCDPPAEPAFFLPPFGGNGVEEAVEACLSLHPRMACVSESFLRRLGRGLKHEEDAGNFDYVYRVEDLVRLAGKKFDGKRNLIRAFEKGWRSRYATLTAERLNGCRSLFREWARLKAARNCGFSAAQERAVLEMLGRFEELGLVGGGVEVDGRLEAFTVGEKLSDDTVLVHLEVVNPSFKGLAQYINREFLRREWSDMTFVNREQDMGLAGLRRAKMSYHPARLVRKYIVWK
jgi:hypothetical protein